ncbi:pickpocket protein 28-like [Ochlerotatus camptorhynchus]|uniref:pickpocket protein 28-like n=1 Tax=Ochlerotatus camptorhynchus TaxID=644619 RepID=UPI0031D6512B
MSSSNHGFLRKLWSEYCQGSTIYATRHLSSQLRIGERVWWFSWIGLALVACFVAIVDVYDKWNVSPVFISYDNRLHPVWAIPFPAITICPMARAQVELFNSTDVYFRIDQPAGISNLEYYRLRAMLHVCPYMSDFYEYNDSLKMNYVQTLKFMSIPFEEMFRGCRYRNNRVDCATYFSESITDSGVCYTFNAIDAEQLFRTENLQQDYLYSTSYMDSYNWTLEDGYLDEFDPKAFPLRPIGGGLLAGLMVVLNTRKADQDFFCEGPVTGYKIGIHSPDEMPSVQNKFYRLSHQNVLTLVLKPELTYISQKVKKYPYYRRQCYFSGERYLRYFKVYNQNNCLAECISNITAQECGCVGFASPRSEDVPVCDGLDLFCPVRSLYKAYKKLETTDRENEVQHPCGCLPACTAIKYDVEISNLPWDFEAYARVLGYPTNEYDSMDPALLLIAFKSKWFLPLKRRELIGVVDLLAKCGGLFGLLMGASVISFLEVVYYCIIRPCRNDYPGRDALRQVFPWVP